jgi:sugar diacid utilization regulator
VDAAQREGDGSAREQLSSLRALLALAMAMTASGDQREILYLATTSVSSFGRVRAEAVLVDSDWYSPAPWGRQAQASELAVKIRALGDLGGALVIAGEPWSYAYPLSSLRGTEGFLLVTAASKPEQHEHFLLTALAQQVGIALANARLHAMERSNADNLLAANSALENANAALQRSLEIHETLTAAASMSDGIERIARAVSELTGFSVAIEDHYGNLVAWAGDDSPQPYPKKPRESRDRLLQRALGLGSPLRADGRLIALARTGDHIFGTIALIDPASAAVDSDRTALEHGATVLAVEFAHLRSIAETERRISRDFIEDLLVGHDLGGVLNRARALDYDLARPHRVVVVEADSSPDNNDDALFHSVRRAARNLEVGSLLLDRAGRVIVLADSECNWDRLHGAIAAELGGVDCRVGIGGLCAQPEDFPRSHQQALFALSMQQTAHGGRAISYDLLGVYRLFSGIPDGESVESFVSEWLGPLMEYDAQKSATLVGTLSTYLECGGNYDATSHKLSLHRSTLRYRLRRLREISGHDLADPDTRFNLQLATRAWRTRESLGKE